MLGNSPLIRGVFSKYFLAVRGFSSLDTVFCRTDVNFNQVQLTSFKDGGIGVGIGVILSRLLSSRFV